MEISNILIDIQGKVEIFEEKFNGLDINKIVDDSKNQTIKPLYTQQIPSHIEVYLDQPCLGKALVNIQNLLFIIFKIFPGFT